MCLLSKAKACFHHKYTPIVCERKAILALQSTSCIECHNHSWHSKQLKGSSGPLYFPCLNKLAGQSHTPQPDRSACAQQHPLATRALPLLVALSSPPQTMDSKSVCCVVLLSRWRSCRTFLRKAWRAQKLLLLQTGGMDVTSQPHWGKRDPPHSSFRQMHFHSKHHKG